MAKQKLPVTPAIRMLRQHDIPFTGHLYAYEDHGGTAVCARELGVDEHAVIKTLILETDQKEPLIVLMHGDCEISTKELARLLGTKQITPCSPQTADRHSGYQVGGTSPFGTRKSMPVYMEETIAELPVIYINGGKRGFLVAITPQDLIKVLQPGMVRVAQP
ncbi:MAG: Cys-tRNA(Pro) deacylase [Pedobacter sp.]|jgi:Cys-tRNA(Pro) deacylase